MFFYGTDVNINHLNPVFSSHSESESLILNPTLLLIGQHQIHRGNFKLIGHLTSLMPYKDTLPCIQSLSADVALPPSEQMGQKITTVAHTKKEDVLDFP